MPFNILQIDYVVYHSTYQCNVTSKFTSIHYRDIHTFNADVLIVRPFKPNLTLISPQWDPHRAHLYLKDGLLNTVAYPVSGVDVPGHLCKFIGPGWGLPFGPDPLARWRILNCLLQFRSGFCGPNARVVCANAVYVQL